MFIKGKQPLLHKVVFELRYRFGFLYLDKCGRIINTILRDHPEWVIRGADPNPTTAGLVSIRNGANFNFSSYNLNLSLEKPKTGEPLNDGEVSVFTDQTDVMCNVIIDQLGLSEFVRIGYRAWYLLGFASMSEAEQWIIDLGFFKVADELTKAFEASVEITNSVVVLAGQDRKFRLAISGVENQAQIDTGNEIISLRSSQLHKNQKQHLIEQVKAKRRMAVNPGFAVMIDVDTFQDKPVSLNVKDFIQRSSQQVEKGLQVKISR